MVREDDKEGDAPAAAGETKTIEAKPRRHRRKDGIQGKDMPNKNAGPDEDEQT